jgi:hypothetical protein
LTRRGLFAGILAARPRGDVVVYIERRGKDYAWSSCRWSSGGETRPDVWIYYSGRWPAEDRDPGRWCAFLDDLLQEMSQWLEEKTGVAGLSMSPRH